jgi:hypothetical protein
MKPVFLAALCLCLPVASVAAGPCFTIYGSDNAVAFQSATSPIDLSRPISEQMKSRFPGHHLVMTQGSGECAEMAGPGGNAKPIASTNANQEKAATTAKRRSAKTQSAGAANPAQ